MSAAHPEACAVFTAHTFTTWELATYFNTPAYGRWLRDRPDYADVFKWHRQMLRHLGSAAPPGQSAGKKALGPPELLPHRDDRRPRQGVPRRPRGYDAPPAGRDPRLARRAADEAALGWQRRGHARRHRGRRSSPSSGTRWPIGPWRSAGPGAVASGRRPAGWRTSSSARCTADPIATRPVRRAYAALGLSLSAGGEAKMRRWVDENAREEHAKSSCKAWRTRNRRWPPTPGSRSTMITSVSTFRWRAGQ
jgi:hypothetical protein